MASKIFNMIFFSLLISSFAIIQMATAGDADIPSDFIIPQNVTTVDGNFFTFIGLRSIVGSNPPPTFKASKASLVEFPALNGHSVSYAVLQFPAGTTNPPHIHPRSAELLFLVDGTLQVGFVDTTNKLFNQTLQTDPRAVNLGDPNFQHLQYNADANNSALAISAFGSANAGTISIPNTLFTTGIDDTILAKSFKTNVATIQALKAGLTRAVHPGRINSNSGFRPWSNPGRNPDLKYRINPVRVPDFKSEPGFKTRYPDFIN
ncbi:hypothetical protein CIPAW_01G259400 [Carya illinoinensis]|uniref:Cupin type-1 domain-containing protein n=1 Tax=Carya illinoinensis TaxID=32201 RepID=A0A8T1RQF5_CARIL|nr:hypothetical protein CIPAW_01G259400 [Carya illinoinensis]